MDSIESLFLLHVTELFFFNEIYIQVTSEFQNSFGVEHIGIVEKAFVKKADFSLHEGDTHRL